MRTFRDSDNKEWTIAVNVSAIKRVRTLVQVDLLQMVDGSLIEQLIRDPVKLCDVVYALCKPAADEQGVSDEEFGRHMAGDAIDRATRALLEELADFSPSPRDRANLQKLLEVTWQAMDKARDVIEARLASVPVDELVRQALATPGSSSGAAPEPSASTPGP